MKIILGVVTPDNWGRVRYPRTDESCRRRRNFIIRIFNGGFALSLINGSRRGGSARRERPIVVPGRSPSIVVEVAAVVEGTISSSYSPS